MPRPEDLHALRIRAKRLRYLLEFLQELTGKPGRLLVKRLTELQDLLGSYHDAVVAADFVRTYVESAGAQLPPASMVALGARWSPANCASPNGTCRFRAHLAPLHAQAHGRRLRHRAAPPARDRRATST